MKNYLSFATQKLKDAKLKISKPRQVVLDLLAHTEKALTPYEMRDVLKKRKIKADVVTIYRILQMLEGMALVHKVLAFNGYVRCHMDEKGERETSCHHYLICRYCHTVDEVHGENLSPLQSKIAKQHRFDIESHYLEFMGLCGNCRKKPLKK